MGIIVALAAVASVAKLGLINIPHDFYPTHAAPAHAESVMPLQACQLEFMTLQAGLYQYMDRNNLTTVPAAGPTRDMTSPVVLYPLFAPNSQTKLAYGWDVNGKVISISAVGANMIPAGCFVSINGH